MGIRLVRSVIQGQQPQPVSTYPNYSLINAQRRASGTRWQIGTFVVASNAQSSIAQLKNAGIDTSSVRIEQWNRYYRVSISENLSGTMRILLYQAGFLEWLFVGGR
jgi:cell division protein FtsN